MIKVAIFGGSFDPPHKGHQYIVQRAIKVLDIDKLIILPAFLNPFKEHSLASAKQRLEWCHRLFDPIADVIVSNFEISLGRATYTSESLRHLGKQYDIRYIIIGSDNLASITRWHEFEWINSHLTWVIAERRGDQKDTQMLQNWIPLKIDIPISSTGIREGGDLKMIDKRIKKEVDILLKRREHYDHR
ncbi:MAG: nicotinate (nicotinamide) nucleotide adenylyltransferase [Campylobacterota bacterium]|nr:nicotinate (nicotinamide) nucleotide adenylyltransferase [Campylobacterota bacterium]